MIAGGLAELVGKLGETRRGKFVWKVFGIGCGGADVVTVAEIEVNATTGGGDEDVMEAGGKSLRARMVGELVTGCGAIETAGADAQCGVIAVEGSTMWKLLIGWEANSVSRVLGILRGESSPATWSKTWSSPGRRLVMAWLRPSTVMTSRMSSRVVT